MPYGYGTSKDFSPSPSGGGGGADRDKKRVKISFTPIAVKIVQGLKKAAKTSRQNVMDYEGQAAGVTPMRNPFPTRGGGGNDRDPQYIPPTTTVKKVEVAKAAVKAAPAGPTTSEVSLATSAFDTKRTAAQEALAVKKRGRTPTILTGSQGLGNNPLIVKKRVLG